MSFTLNNCPVCGMQVNLEYGERQAGDSVVYYAVVSCRHCAYTTAETQTGRDRETAINMMLEKWNNKYEQSKESEEIQRVEKII